jgi:preprotein translocase subunit SecY
MKKNLPLILFGTGIAILVGVAIIFKKQIEKMLKKEEQESEESAGV